MTRRSFCFLFGAGVGALALGVGPSVPDLAFDSQKYHFVWVTEELLRDSAVNVDVLARDWVTHMNMVLEREFLAAK